jgi:hypothetical protein
MPTLMCASRRVAPAGLGGSRAGGLDQPQEWRCPPGKDIEPGDPGARRSGSALRGIPRGEAAHRRFGRAPNSCGPGLERGDRPWRAWLESRGRRRRRQRSSSAKCPGASRGSAEAPSRQVADTTPSTPWTPRRRSRWPRPSRHVASGHSTEERRAREDRSRKESAATTNRRPNLALRESAHQRPTRREPLQARRQAPRPACSCRSRSRRSACAPEAQAPAFAATPRCKTAPSRAPTAPRAPTARSAAPPAHPSGSGYGPTMPAQCCERHPSRGQCQHPSAWRSRADRPPRG